MPVTPGVIPCKLRVNVPPNGVRCYAKEQPFDRNSYLPKSCRGIIQKCLHTSRESIEHSQKVNKKTAVS